MMPSRSLPHAARHTSHVPATTLPPSRAQVSIDDKCTMTVSVRAGHVACSAAPASFACCRRQSFGLSCNAFGISLNGLSHRQSDRLHAVSAGLDQRG